VTSTSLAEGGGLNGEAYQLRVKFLPFGELRRGL